MRGRTMSRVAAATFTILLVAVSASAVSAASPVRFGAKLTTNTQPSNSSPAHDCEPTAGQSCTRVMTQAYGRNSAKAPKDGTIGKIRLIAGDAGSLRVYIAKVKDGTKAKVVLQGSQARLQRAAEQHLELQDRDLQRHHPRQGGRGPGLQVDHHQRPAL